MMITITAARLIVDRVEGKRAPDTNPERACFERMDAEEKASVAAASPGLLRRLLASLTGRPAPVAPSSATPVTAMEEPGGEVVTFDGTRGERTPTRPEPRPAATGPSAAQAA